MVQNEYLPPVWFDEVDSTNLYVRDNFDSLADGTLVAARFQRAGRGRLGRKWHSGRDLDLTATVKVSKVSESYHAGVLLGLAALEALREEFPEGEFFFKWPNDIYCGSSKLAGILCEGIISGGRLCGVAAGIGINVNSSGEFLNTVGGSAVSLKELAGHNFVVEKLADKLAKHFHRLYIKYNFGIDQILSMWRKENRLIGKVIKVTDTKGAQWSGEFCDIASDGSLMMRLADGSVRCFSCADVSVDRNSLA
jgi:BirA family biotin operon repressor/biotin-[acetyl-CoA-carboxylase] ligase